MQNFQLHSLCLSDCIRLTTESLLELLSEVSVVCSLRYLDLSGCHAAVTDAVVKAVVDTCWPSLESLSLASCTRITEEGITYLARASCRYRSGFVSLDWEENLFDQQRNHPAHWADSESPLSIPSHALLRLRKLDLSYINLSHKAADACGCLGASLIALHLAECEVEGKPANNSYRSNRDGWIVSLLRESRKLRELDVHGIRSVRAPGSVHEDDEEHNLYQAGQVLAMQQSQEAQDQHDEQMQDLQKKYHQMQQSIYQWQIDQSNACELPKAIFTRVSESSLSNYVSSSSELVASPGSPQTDYSDQISEGSDDSFSSGTSAALFIDPDSASSTSSLHTTILNTIPTLPHLSNLSHLNLGHFTTATDSQLSILMRHCGPDLRSLNLSHCVSLTDATALSISRHCRALRELTLYSVEKLSDTGLAFVASQCGPGLGWLNLAQCAEIGSYGVESVARYCTSLRVLNVGGCRGKPGIGFDVLAELARRCRQLKVVRVAGTGINQEDLDALEDNFRWIYWDVT
ncbi:hypothetical protein BJ742DRAFT_797055 [Cladochytrium replicatum]|nr:hypothetical protein BJ742DRAFT_797055 [Cladochytrium replicatum]